MTAQRVLVVDDEKALLLTLSANLELEGFEVTSASSAEAALKLLEQESFDVVLSDIRMPGMSGVELLRRVKALRPDITILLMTAFATEGLVSEAIRDGVYAVLQKPFDLGRAVVMLTRAGEKRAVLVVDDEPAPAAQVMRAARHRVQVAAGVEGALAALNKDEVDVCVVDVVDRSADALALLQSEASARVAVIALTDADLPAQLQRTLAQQTFATLPAPLDAVKLLGLIAQARLER